MNKKLNTDSSIETKQMTLVLQPSGEVKIKLAGMGTAFIDWGDGTQCETHKLTDFNEDDWKQKSKYNYCHNYCDNSTCVIIITGDNITHLCCESMRLTNLDVSKNTGLIYLDCFDNQLTSLDVSSNNLLKELCCSTNQITSLKLNTELSIINCRLNLLTSLDVRKLPKLRALNCSQNQITNLDVSKNAELEYLSCIQNQITKLDISNNEIENLRCDTTVDIFVNKKDSKEELTSEMENIQINIDLSSFLHSHTREELIDFLNRTE